VLSKAPATEALWTAFRDAVGLSHDDYVVVRFGDSAALADALLELVLAGTKRATACLLRDFGEGYPVPRVGDFVMVVDSRAKPRAIWRTTWVAIRSLIEVDDGFAWDEGEGDRSRASWLEDHRRCFGRQATREGFVMHDRIETVFERFEIVWPPEVADRRPA
jgi:uncharacterized protein YhfF